MANFPVYNACDLIAGKNTENLIVVHDLHDLLADDRFIPKKPHAHTFYQVLYVEKGSGIHKIDFEEHNIDAPIIYFISTGQIHDLIFEKKVTDGILINFNAGFFGSFLAQSYCIDTLPFFEIGGNISFYKIRENHQKEIKEIFKKISTEYKIQNRKSYDLLRVYLLELFYLILNDINDNNENINITKQKNTINKFRKLVEENYTMEHYPKFYADKLAITANYLNFICRNYSGKKAGEIIRDRIILETKRMLVNSEFSISQIAFRLGFEDNSYFTKFFKTYAGLSPSEFKGNLKK